MQRRTRIWFAPSIRGTAIVFLIVGGGIDGGEPRAGGREFLYSEPHMGTRFRILLYAEREPVANRAAQAAFARIAELEQIFSTYRPDSEARKLCAKAAVGEWTHVSDDLWRVLKFSRAFSEKTGGAFDVTVGPVTRLWRQARRAHRLPNPEKLAAAQQAVGYRYYEVDPNHPRVRLLRSSMRFDFGGIAKGYALDQAFAVLTRHGISRCSVEGGGDLYVGDTLPSRPRWEVQLPEFAPSKSKRRFPLFRLPPRHAVATSGDTYQHLTVAGKRYSHILDPRTGQAIEGRRGASVFAPTGMEADAWASACCVLELDQIEKLLACQSNLAARVYVETASPPIRTFGGLWKKIEQVQ